MTSGSATPMPPFQRQLARSTLLILLLLSIGPLLLMGSAAYLRTRNLLREQEIAQMRTAANVQGERITSEVITGRQLLIQTLSNPEVANRLRDWVQSKSSDIKNSSSLRLQILHDLQSLNRIDPYFSQYLLIAPDGNVRLASTPAWESMNLANSPIFQLDDSPVSKAIYGAVPLFQNEFILTSQVPLLDSHGEVIAVLVGITEPDIIQDWIHKSTFFSERSFFVTRDGTHIGLDPWAEDNPKLTALEATHDQKMMQEFILAQPEKQGVRQLISFGDQPVIAAYTWLPEMQISWVAETTLEKVYSQLNSLLIFSLLVFLATALLLALIVWQVTRFLVHPLTQLARTVSKFAEGNWDERVNIPRKDEIGQLGYSFNKMADDLSSLYRSLESKVKERTNQLQVSGEIAQIGVSSSSLDELLQRSVNMLSNRFSFPFVAVYLLDETGEYAILRQAAAPLDVQKSSRGLRVKVQPLSLVGWVALTNSSKVDLIGQGAFGALERVDLAPQARAEAGVPIVISERVLGVLVAQANRVSQLNDDTIRELQILANQLAPAVQNFYLLEATQINLQETNLIYQYSHQIAQASTADDITELARRALHGTSYPAFLLLNQGDHFSIIRAGMPVEESDNGVLAMSPANMLEHLRSSGPYLLTNSARASDLPLPVVDLIRDLKSNTVAFLPVLRNNKLAAVLLLGSGEEDARGNIRFTQYNLQPYTNLVELITTALEKVNALETTQDRLRELEILNEMSRVIARQMDLETVYHTLHEYVREVLGDVIFSIAKFETETGHIDIPYSYSPTGRIHAGSAEFDKGPVSIIIRSRQPLRIVEESGWIQLESSTGIPMASAAKSWLGVPVQVGSDILGALFVEDDDNEGRFSTDDERFLTTLANQAGVALRNLSLLENARQKAKTESMLVEITGKIRRATSIPEILETTAKELGVALNAKRAQIAIQPVSEDTSLETAIPDNRGNGNGSKERE